MDKYKLLGISLTFLLVLMFCGAVSAFDQSSSVISIKDGSYLVPFDVTSNSLSMVKKQYRLPYKLHNIGTKTARNFVIRIYLTPTKSLKGKKYLIGKQLIKSLAPGRTIKIRSKYYIPAKYFSYKHPKKKYYVAVVANKVAYSHIKMGIVPYNPNY